MCIHDHAVLNRRHLGSLVLGAAGASLLPRAAFASATIKALCLTCIDYRFLNKDAAFVANELNLFKDSDIVALAGGSLAAVANKTLPLSEKAFWQQLDVAWSLHKFETVVMIDHMDCGAYKAEFPTQDEHTEHLRVMREVAAKLRSHERKFTPVGFLMPADLSKCAEPISL
jgi:carbonic anhydrase